MAPISVKMTNPQHKDVVLGEASATSAMTLRENSLGGFLPSHGHHNHGHGHHHSHSNNHHSPQYHHHLHHNHNVNNNNNNNHHHHNHHQHAKENAAAGKGLEILDFHESWLEEMEVYKDLMHVKKFGFHNPQVQKLTVSRFDMANGHNQNVNKFSPQLVQVSTTNTSMLDNSLPSGIRMSGGASGTITNNAVKQANAKRQVFNEKKSRVRVATSMAAAENDAADGVHEAGLNNMGNINQLHLKRPREETAVSGKTTISNSHSSHNKAKRSGHSNSSTLQATKSSTHLANAHTNRNNNKSAKSISNAVNNSAYASDAAISQSSSPAQANYTPRNNTKIIINQFHASSLLNGHQLVDKQKILAQNGIREKKTSLTAYEASYYAANYLNGATNATTGNGDQDYDNAFDEPSAAIDDVNTCSDTDSEEEYIGEPFYLVTDKDERFQSKTNFHSPEPIKIRSDTPNKASTDIPNKASTNTPNKASAADTPNKASTNTPNKASAADTPNKANAADTPNQTSTDTSNKPSSDIANKTSTDTPDKTITDTPDKTNENTPDVETEEPSEYFTPKSILTPSLFPNVPPYLNYSSHTRVGPSMPQQLHKVLKWKLSPVMPRIVKRIVLNSGFRIIKNTMEWMAVWEKHMKSPGFRTIRSHQKYNHMPGSFRIGRKDTMWRSIRNNMKKYGAKEFGFMQKSYIMPEDLEELRLAWPKNAARLTKWILKPPASARGTGISIINKWSQFPKDRPIVVQRYIERPLLINDNKFDMRLYVAMTSINPLKIYLYKDGLARFASVKYSPELNSLDQRCMHLTNYSINKYSVNYTKNQDFNACQGHKWTLQSLWSCLENRGVNTKRLWATLRNLVIKTLISGEAGMNRTYRQNINFRYNVFELFGFDVLLDENLVPWLLEVNISPSLHSELPLDLHVKGPLIQAVLNTALYQVPPKLSEKQQKEILDELQLKGPLCHDKRIFTTCLAPEEVRKHNQFTNRSIELREEYVDAILEHLNPDDVRCLVISEDELNRCCPLERIFPTQDTHKYLKFIEHPRYYNRLLDAWENRYGHCRQKGVAFLSKFCEENYHLQVPESTNEKEPTGTLTEIDLLHVKKEEPVPAAAPVPPPTDNVDTSSTATSTDSCIKID